MSSVCGEFRGTLLPHQVEGVAFLRATKRGILADSPGLGKTIQVLAALDGPATVVAPAGVLDSWRDAVRKFRPDLVDQIDLVSWDVLSEHSTVRGVLVLDEVHRAKSPWTAARAKAAMRLAQQTDVCWGLSGTPLPNEVQDLWGILLVMGLAGRIGADAFHRAIEWSGDKATGVRPEMSALLAPHVLRRDKSVLDLPEKRHRPVRPHVIPGRKSYVDLRALERDKVQWLRGAWTEFVGPLIVFVRHVDVAQEIGGWAGWACIHGGTDTKIRSRIIEEYQSGALAGIAITTAGAEGITLTRARTVLRLSLDWTPGTNLQVEDRCHRVGLDHEVDVVDVIVDCDVERRLHERLRRRRRVQREAGF